MTENESEVMSVENEDELFHYGILRRSGRYPWGSGDNAYQNATAFQKFIKELSDKGMTHAQMAEFINKTYPGANITWQTMRDNDFSSTSVRDAQGLASAIIRSENVHRAQQLREKGYKTTKIAEIMGAPNESTVRGWLKRYDEGKQEEILSTMNALKQEVAEKGGYLDVGKGTELKLGISTVSLNKAITALRDEGYMLYKYNDPQVFGAGETHRKVLCPPDTSYKELMQNRHRVQNVLSYKDLDGEFHTPSHEPVSVKSKRIQVRYDEDGGGLMDGVIELRPGVEDLSLGEKRYAQVRIAVDDSHYLKGMAIYSNDLPAGVDIRVNSPKSKKHPDIVDQGDYGAMKPLKDDPFNRFGASVIARKYKNSKGDFVDGPMNIVNEEGKWDDWSKTLSSQFLSKQPITLASTQLKKAYDKRLEEFNEISRLTNPIVKQKLLLDFAEKTDSASADLKGHALKDQKTKVLLPMNSMRPGEIFAPDFQTGDRVALVRYPHGGRFEIPELVVNNRNLTARKIMGGALDAVGIHASVAAKLSGADFDGDTVMVIPNNDGRVKSYDPKKGPLAELRNFDAKREYPEVEGMKRMTKLMTQQHMGKVSNLITDMTIKGASDADLAAAVRHSMVVIDAEKHKLNYKLSEQVNGISRLKEKYQGGAQRGASTTISRARSEERIDERRAARVNEGGAIDPNTGKLNWVETGRSYPQRKKDPTTGEWYETGKIIKRTTETTKMDLTDDAHTLVSKERTRMEEVYADHANSLKSLANRARKDAVNVVEPEISPAAKRAYAPEVASLKKKLDIAKSNAPLERQAQQIADAWIKQRMATGGPKDKDQIKKIKTQSLNDARTFVGTDRKKFGSKQDKTMHITSREWEAIQARAVPKTTLRDIMANAELDHIKELATPRPRTTLTTGQQARIRQMNAQGRSASEIADSLGLPRSTVAGHLKAE